MNNLKIKGVHFCVFPETKLKFLEKCIRTCAGCGYTHVVLEFWGMLRYDCMKELGWDIAYSKEEVKSAIDTARSLGIEIIPMFNHLGHAAQSRGCSGKHVVLDQNPGLGHLFNSYGWEWDIEKDEVLDLLRQIRMELIGLCGDGKYFHLGCDEAYMFGTRENASDILCDYLNGIQSELSKVGRRAIIWGDMLLAESDFENEKYFYQANLKSAEASREALRKLDKKIIIADWQYDIFSGKWKSSAIFKKAGFDVLCCPWDNMENARTAVDCAVDEELFGVIHTTWNTLQSGFRTMVYTGLLMNSEDRNAVIPKEVGFIASSIVRKMMPSGGKYEDAGWREHQI